MKHYLCSVLIVQSCPILFNPLDCSSPSFSVHGILQATILEKKIQGIFLTQGSNLCLLHCRQILYCLSHQERPQREQFSQKKSHRNETFGTFSRSVGKSSAIPPITIRDNALVFLEQWNSSQLPYDRWLFLTQSPSKRQKLANRKRSEKFFGPILHFVRSKSRQMMWFSWEVIHS